MRDPRPLYPRLALGVRAILAAALAAVFFLAVASPAAAATLVVNTTLDQAIGGCPASCSLRDAVLASSTGDIIRIPAGTYVLTDHADGVIEIPRNMNLVGAGARTTVIDGDGSGIFSVDGGNTVVIAELSLVNSSGQPAIVATSPGDLNLLLDNLTIADNQNGFLSTGGGVNASNLASIFVLGCTFSNNFAGTGGGLYAENIHQVIIIDSTFFGNQAVFQGSAIAVSQSPIVTLLLNVTLTANINSPALAVDGAASLSIFNTIISGNLGGGCSFGSSAPNGSFAFTHNLDRDGSCGFTDPGSLTGVDPHLGPLANNGGTTDTAALLRGSPAIDAGDDATCIPVDQRGVSRPQGAHCDIGAYEAPPTPQSQIAALIAQINALVSGGSLAQNKANPLITKLTQVSTKLDAGQATAACGQFGAFLNQLNADIHNGTLTPAQGQPLLDAANATKASMGC